MNEQELTFRINQLIEQSLEKHKAYSVTEIIKTVVDEQTASLRKEIEELKAIPLMTNNLNDSISTILKQYTNDEAKAVYHIVHLIAVREEMEANELRELSDLKENFNILQTEYDSRTATADKCIENLNTLASDLKEENERLRAIIQKLFMNHVVDPLLLSEENGESLVQEEWNQFKEERNIS